jgi:hypothetical protein
MVIGTGQKGICIFAESVSNRLPTRTSNALREALACGHSAVARRTRFDCTALVTSLSRKIFRTASHGPRSIEKRTEARPKRSTRNPRHFLEQHLVEVAPAPRLARLQRSNQRVLRLIEVRRCMPVLRIIATSDVATGETQAQPDPGVADLEAVFASLRAWPHGANLIEMLTAVDHCRVRPFQLR